MLYDYEFSSLKLSLLLILYNSCHMNKMFVIELYPILETKSSFPLQDSSEYQCQLVDGWAYVDNK
ncbi:hypothetical protein BLOT_005020 [Blomia tropicalis]|nr:hypothetical protein BLOT_005020 [Blomia tropicalis]